MRRVAFLIAIILLFGVRADATSTVTPTTRVAVGAIEKGAAVKAATVAGKVTKLLHTDAASLMTGVATTGGVDGASILVMEVQGVQTLVVSDGTTVIAPGDLVQPSDTVDGRFMKGVGNPVCSATQAAAAVAGTLFNCL